MPNPIVCIKHSIDVAQLRIDPRTSTPLLQEAPKKISDFDKNALEEAIRIKEKHGGKVTVLSMASWDVGEALKEALAMGADEAYALSDPAFKDTDYGGKAAVLARAIEKIGGGDVILCGEASIDDYSSQLGPRLAEELGMPQITYVSRIDLEENNVVAERDLEDAYEVVEAEMPILITVTKEINEPRLPTLLQILGASKKPITLWSASDLGFTPQDLGADASAIERVRCVAPSKERKGIIFKEDLDEAVNNLAKELIKEGVVRG